MTLYHAEWTIKDEAIDDTLTYFGSMDPEQDRKDRGPDIEMLGRWSKPGAGGGALICRAKNADVLSGWMLNWATKCTITVHPTMDDNEAREVILGREPAFQAPYDEVGDEPKHGETLYMIKYQFKESKRLEGQYMFANMTKKQEDANTGATRTLGHWYNLGTGCGMVVSAAKSAKDLYKCALNWTALCEMEISPVLTDAAARAVIRARPDHKEKAEALMSQRG